MLRRVWFALRHRLPHTRELGLAEELHFWRDWLASGGSKWPEDYQRRLDPLLPLQDHIRRWVDEFEEESVRILDVGAGPLTKLGKIHPFKRIEVVATDALAPKYDQLLKKSGVTPPVRTLFADAEDLSWTVGADQFHLVHAENCLDHMSNPLKAIGEMLKVVKLGHPVLLIHAENEAEKMSYRGLHEWNFRLEGSALVVNRKNEEAVNVPEKFREAGHWKCWKEGEKVLAVVRKTPVSPG